jgi:hypothetical protein
LTGNKEKATGKKHNFRLIGSNAIDSKTSKAQIGNTETTASSVQINKEGLAISTNSDYGNFTKWCASLYHNELVTSSYKIRTLNNPHFRSFIDLIESQSLARKIYLENKMLLSQNKFSKKLVYYRDIRNDLSVNQIKSIEESAPE